MKYGPGSVINQYAIVSRTERKTGNGNVVYRVRCLLCRKQLERTLDKMRSRQHTGCFRFNREKPVKHREVV